MLKNDAYASFFGFFFWEPSMTHNFQCVSSRAGGGGVAGSFTLK